MSFQLSYDEILDLCAGACVLASGGGGSYVVAKRIVENGIEPHRAVTVKDVDELSPDAYTCTCAIFGAPSPLFVHTNAFAPANALDGLTRVYFPLINKPEAGFDALCPIEMGAINATAPIATAAQKNLPLVNADTAGRALPLLPLVLFTAHENDSDFRLFPSCLATEDQPDGGYHAGYVNIAGPNAAEPLQAALLSLVQSPPFGGIAGWAAFPMPIAALQRRRPVEGTIYDAWKIGEIIRTEQSGSVTAERIVQYLAKGRQPQFGPRVAKTIFHGFVTYMTQKSGGTDVGQVIISANADGSGEQLTVYFENENLCASLKGSGRELFVMGPDSVCYLPAGPLGTPANPVVDNSDLFNLWQWGVRPLELYVLAIDAPAVVKQNKVLMERWMGALSGSVGYSGPYRQPWLADFVRVV